MSYVTFKNQAVKQAYDERYAQSLAQWNIPTERFYINTSFGPTHVIACGPKGAPPLVLIHGMTVSSTMWFANAPDWCQKFRVFAIDTIGDFGKSECSKPISSAKDIDICLNEILDALDLEETFLIGHSMGGWISLQFSLNSKRIKKLVLFAPVMSFAPLNWKFPFKLFPALWFRNSFFIRNFYNWMFAKENIPNETLYNQFFIGYKCGKINLRVAPKVFKKEELERLQAETLVLIGEQEVIYSSTKKAIDNAAAIPKITALLIPNCSHCLPAEQNEIVNDLITKFLL